MFSFRSYLHNQIPYLLQHPRRPRQLNQSETITDDTEPFRLVRAKTLIIFQRLRRRRHNNNIPQMQFPILPARQNLPAKLSDNYSPQEPVRSQGGKCCLIH